MVSLKLAVATFCFAQPLKTSLKTAADLGVEAVQLDSRSEVPPEELTATGRRQLRHYLEELRLDLASLRFPTRRTFYDQEHLEARISALKESMKLGWDLKARVVTTRIGKLPEENTPEMHLLREVVGDLAAYSNQTGVVLAVTPTNDSPASLKAFLESVAQGPVGLNFDPAVFVMSGHSPTDAFRKLHKFVNHVQARDAVREQDGGGAEVPVGCGEVDWDELLVLLGESGYPGWITLERNGGEDKLGDLTRAVSYLRRVVPG